MNDIDDDNKLDSVSLSHINDNNNDYLYNSTTSLNRNLIIDRKSSKRMSLQ